jgi:hypothetical protein
MVTSTDLSPYDSAAQALFYSRAQHFAGAAEVWQAFADRKISSKRREDLLSVLRGRLSREVPLLK